MAELGSLFKLRSLPPAETPEAMYLGLRPDEGQLRQGPLTVSALNADPPDRSTHFHLSLMSLRDGVAGLPGVVIQPEEQREIMELAKKLNTKHLTIVEGEGLDHGLVWEGLGDMRTTPAAEIDGKAIRPVLPEGDTEVTLRRFIDDSINLLSEIEMNARRIDEDVPPLNMLWPWGQGVRLSVPNLALRRGKPAFVISSSMRLHGLSRLAGYRHIDRRETGRGLNMRLASFASKALSEEVTLILLDPIAEFRSREMPEEADWFTREIESALLAPLFADALITPTQIAVLAPGRETGLGVVFQTGDKNSNSIPFDERALEERSLGVQALWESGLV